MGATPAEQIPAQGAESAEPLTPMMRQYLETKAAHPGCILFFRLGDFYEMFFDDAVQASEILQIALTSRAKGSDRVPMCGVPFHAARRYVARLIERGLKVALCDQVEEAGKGTLVKREVIRVVTPGMVLDEEVLDSRSNNFLAAVSCGERGYGGALLDGSTGEFLAFERETAEEAAEVLDSAAVRELVVPEDQAQSKALEALRGRLSLVPSLTTVEAAGFAPQRADAYLRAHFQVASLAGFGVEELPLARGAAAAALRYLKDTQKTGGAHVDRLAVLPPGGALLMDESTRHNLELHRSMRDGGRRGTLLGVLDRCATGMGARKLQRWVLTPLCSKGEIEARLDAVQELSAQTSLRQSLLERLQEISDVERLTGRLTLGAGNARDLKSLGRSLEVLPALAAQLGDRQSALLRSLAPPLSALGELEALLGRAVVDEPPLALKEGGLIKPGFHQGLDELVALSTSGKDVLLSIEAREKERTGIASLKVRFNKVFGYYLEVTRPNLDKVPSDYIRKQTTANGERFVTPELKEYEEKVLTAEERRCALEYELFEQLRGEVVRQASALRAAAGAVAACDALVSLARAAAEYGYCRPEVDESEALEIEAGRHPVVERMLDGERFVPNDVQLDRQQSQILVITGPNMAGKSTVMRQVALTVLMAQAGSFVPAKRARVGLCDRIFTRVGASDNLAKGQSTFMVEMTETANILHHATRKSLVVLDEIGRGTSTFDGLSIAWAVAEQLHDRVGARTLFATHYHELTDLARDKPRVRNATIAVKEHEGKVVFLRKLVAGGASRSYGIEVARLAGLPPEVVGRAREILLNLESGELDEAGKPRLSRSKVARRGPEGQLGLFVGDPGPAVSEAERALLRELKELTVDTTTPLEALNLLYRWKRESS
ncbi:MAG TPA: DNA mismatch repair protein MutS [Myxococcaceae bacterium]|jgi:DNA mismatch repair protein MutS